MAPSVLRRPATRNVAIFGFFLLVAVVFAMPVDPTRYRTVVPGDSGDTLLNLWILDWVGHHLGSGWSGLWDTSMFWPNHNTLAYSESLVPVAVVHRALSGVLGSDVLAFNVIYIGAWTLSGWITYLLTRHLTGSTAGALVAGFVYTVATPRLAHYGHFQLAMGFLVPLVLLVLVRFFEAPSLARGALLGLTTGLLALSTSYYGLMVFVALAVLVPGMVIWTWRRADRSRILTGLALAAVVGAVIVVPVAWQYRDLQQDPHFRRDPDPSGYAQLSDFLRVTPDNYLLADLPPFESRSRPESATIERRLYPGIPAVVLGLVGFVYVIRKRRTLLAERGVATRLLILLVPTALLLLVLAFGDALHVHGVKLWMPYSLLHDAPGFSGIRATARFVAFPLLVLALFAAVGLGLVARARTAVLDPRRHRGGSDHRHRRGVDGRRRVHGTTARPGQPGGQPRARPHAIRVRCWSSRSGHRTTVGPGPTSRRPGSTWRGSTATRASAATAASRRRDSRRPPRRSSRSRATRPSTASMISGSATWCSAPVSRTDSPPPRPKASVSTASVCTATRTPGRSSTRCHRTASRASTSTATRG